MKIKVLKDYEGKYILKTGKTYELPVNNCLGLIDTGYAEAVLEDGTKAVKKKAKKEDRPEKVAEND